LNLLGLAIFAFEMNRSYGLSTYWLDPAEIRRDSQSWSHMGVLGLLVLFTYPVVILSVLQKLLWRRWTVYNVAGLVLGALGAELGTGRGDLVMYLITAAFLCVYYNHWRSWNRRLLFLMGSLLVACTVYFLAVGAVYGKLVKEESQIYHLQDFSSTSQPVLLLASPYIYATADFPALDQAIASSSDRTWGARTFFPIARVLYAFGFTSHLPDWTEFDHYLTPVPVNTFTHLYSFYTDFGVAGVLVLPFALGLLETNLYISMRTRADLFSFGMTPAFMVVNLFSVFIPLISTVTIWYLAATLWLVGHYCQRSTGLGK
jgi:oligosaccharide repeat unit polymerase